MSLQRIKAQGGAAFVLNKGQLLRVIDPYGEQVADLTAFALEDNAEWLSSGRSIDYNDTIYLTSGHSLYSNRSRVMLTIQRDTVGRHDFLYTPCSPETFTLLYQDPDYHPSCFENMSTALQPYGISADRIPTTFNVFMNVEMRPNGAVKVLPPLSRAGDFIEFRAEMGLIVALTACSAEMSNNYRFKPIGYEILDQSG